MLYCPKGYRRLTLELCGKYSNDSYLRDIKDIQYKHDKHDLILPVFVLFMLVLIAITLVRFQHRYGNNRVPNTPQYSVV